MTGRRVHPFLKAVTVVTLGCFVQFTCLTPLLPSLVPQAMAQEDVDDLLESDDLDLIDSGKSPANTDKATPKDAKPAQTKDNDTDDDDDDNDANEEDKGLLDAAKSDKQDMNDDDDDDDDDDTGDVSELMISVDFNKAAPAVNGPKKILVLFSPTEKELAGELAQLRMTTELWLRKHPDYTVIPVNLALGDKNTPSEAEAVTLGNREYEEAKRAYEALDFDTVIEKMPRAIEHLLPFGHYPEHKKRLLECLHLLAAAYHTDEEEDLAKETFVRALSIDPKATLSADFPPGVQSLYIKVRERLEFQSSGSVKILSKPDKIPVFFDGRYWGLTPIAERKIAAGEHFFQTEIPGFEDYRTKFRVYPDTSKTLQIGTRRVAKYYQYQGELNDVLERMDHLTAFKNVTKLHQLTGTDNLLFVDVRTKQDTTVFRGLVYDMSSKKHRYYETTANLVAVSVNKVYPAFLEALFKAPEEDNAITEEMLAARQAEREAAKDKSEQGAVWYESWWFWTIIGAVVVGTAVGVGVGVGMKDDGKSGSDDENAWAKPNAIRITF